jgi:glycosyltransferase involved in cell wall biosynthesis
MPPAVSVIIPVHNRAPTLRRAIDSVLAQTYQDFELIVVDDGSTDGSASVAAAVIDKRIAVVQHTCNRGASAARNTGIQATRAPYVAFLDSDDVWLPTKIERQLGVFGSSDTGVALVYTGVERIFADGTTTCHVPKRQRHLERALLLANVIGETSVGMLRRSALDAVGGFDESLPSSQDLDLWLRVCTQFPAAAVPEVLVRIDKGDNPDRVSANVARTIRGRELYGQKHRDKLIHHGVLHEYLRETGWWWQHRAGDVKSARRLYREALAARPLAPLTHVLLLSSYAPHSWLRKAANAKRYLNELRFSRVRHS